MTVELRIHGVGGSPGPQLVGLSRPEEVVVVGEGVGTAFLARRHERAIEGYDWGALTSGSILQPSWLLLLPFTLMNVAGWMHEPFDGKPWRIRLVRALVHVLAGSLTASYTLWIALLAVDHLGYRWLPPEVGVAAGAALTGGLMWGLARIARNTVTEFEHRRPASAPEIEPPAWTPEETMSSAGFFDHAASVTKLRARHGVVQSLALAVALVLTLRAWAAGAETTGIGWAIVVVFTAQIVAVSVLVALTLAPAGRAPARRTRCRPAVAAILALSSANGFFAGGALLVAQLLRLPPAPAPELALVDVYLVLMILSVVATVVFVAWHRQRATADELPPRQSGPGEELDGVDDAWRRKVRHARGLATAGREADRLLAFVALTALAVAAYLGLHRLLGNDPCQPWDWSGGGGLRPCGEGFLGWAGALLTGFLGVLFGLVRQSMTTTKVRRAVGIIWDVLTFWPRRFHPYAVRPYAERAVPEFQARIRRHVGQGQPVLVSGHSQGSVLAFAALAPLRAECLGSVALVTHGCPITTLYAPNFPAYFGPDEVLRLRQRLLGWRNLHRQTDPIGGPVFAAGDVADICVEDPATLPRADAIPVSPVGLEEDRRAWTEVAGHSGFYLERRMKQESERLKKLLDRDREKEEHDEGSRTPQPAVLRHHRG